MNHHYKPRMQHKSNVWEYIAYGTLVVGAGIALYIQGTKQLPKPTEINVNVTIQNPTNAQSGLEKVLE